MASPLRYKAKWPSQRKQSGTDVSDFVPYVSNLVNSFRKVPRPMAPKQINPVTGTQISLADAKGQVANETRAADLSTQGLDAQTGAAIRVGNTGNKLRALSELNSKEAQINAQTGNQTRMINANIDAQNTNIVNAYHDDITNAQIAQQREQSENISNAADKYIGQQTARDQNAMELKKATILSKMYNPGVYKRLSTSLADSGVNIGYQAPQQQGNVFANTASMVKPLATPTDNLDTTLSPDNLRAMQKYMQQRQTYAAGGMMKVFTTGGDSGDPGKPVASRDPYYQSSAALAYYKDQLNSKLKAKNPEGFSNYFKGLVDLRRSGDTTGANKYVQSAGYNDYLSPEEVKSTLGKDGYNRYLSSLKTVNDYNVQQGQQPLYGTVEGENDITKLNYGRRFASLQLTPSLSITNTTRNTKYSRNYAYDPVAGQSNYTEEGDLSLRPDYVSAPQQKAAGGSIYINPANKGKFNALKARTGKSTEELTHSSNALTRKRAIFAQNAAKWKHAYGGSMTKPFC